MALKAISEVEAVINSVSVSGTTQVISQVANIKYKDSVAVQIGWSGNNQGTFTIDGSLNYSAGQPQSGAPLNAGDWSSLNLSSNNCGSSTNFPVVLNLNQLSFPYLRVTYTNSTGSGILSAYTFSKSLG